MTGTCWQRTSIETLERQLFDPRELDHLWKQAEQYQSVSEVGRLYRI